MSDIFSKVVSADFVDPDFESKMQDVIGYLERNEQVPVELSHIEETVLYFYQALKKVGI